MRKIRTPTVLQMEAVECGAAALGIILGYYGRFVPLEELRIACGISRGGSKAINILKAARKYGLEASGAKADLEGVKNIQAPFIVFWQFNHFIVIEEFKANKVYINDPATGRRSISLEEFDKGFTGVLLLLRPDSSFIKQPRSSQLQSALLKRMRNNYPALAFITLITLFLVLPGIIFPGFLVIFIDYILVKGMDSWFPLLLVGMLLVMLLQTLLIYLQKRFLLRLQIKMLLSMSTQFFWHVLHLPMQFFYQRFAGDLVDRINANDRIANLLSAEITGSLVSLLSMVFFALILVLVSWPLALASFFVASLNIGLLFFVSKKIVDSSRYFLQQTGKLTGFEMTGIYSIETLKASASEDDFFKRWAGYHATIIMSQQKIAAYNQYLLIIPQTLNNLLAVLILTLGSYFIIKGQLTVGTLVAFQAILINFNQPLANLLGIGNRLQQVRADLMRVDDVFYYPEHIDPITQKEKKPDGSMVTVNLGFGYSPLDPPLLKHINLSIKPGAAVAIIGKTGSGKSTLAKLLTGLYPPDSGEIYIGGELITLLSQSQRSRILAYVDQDIFLFEGTIRQNLTLWDESIPDAILENAIQCVGAADFLLGRGSLDAFVAEKGTNFSGGQRQRIEIARALIKKPLILLLDEATANLDVPLEQNILAKLRKLGLTLLVITHRLEATKDFDQILVLENGFIVDQGSPGELIERKSIYYNLE